MTPEALVNKFRDLADDHAEPPLWSDAVIMVHANEGQMEAARRLRYFVDSRTSSVCELDVPAATSIDDAVLDLDQRVLRVNRVKLDTMERALPKVLRADLERYRPGWEEDEPGDPVCWVPWDNGTIRIVPPPATADTARLTVIREPITEAALEDGDSGTPAVPFELPARMHQGVLHWAMHKAFLQRERQDMYRPEESRQYLDFFEAEFGKKSTALDEEWLTNHNGVDDYDGAR